MRRMGMLAGSLVLAGACCLPARAQAPAAAGVSLDEAVQKAIDKGVAYIWSQRRDDGTWPPHGGGRGAYTVGPTALAAYALLESGVSPQEERMAKTIEWLAKNDDNMNYSVDLRCQVWLIVNRQTRNKYIKEFEADVKALVKEGIRWEGKYTYEVPCPGGGGQFDNSNCQFGVLGVWAGARANMEFIEDKYWWKVAKLWIGRQCPDGGWAYLDTGQQGNASMTAAGVATLFVCTDNLLSEAFIKCDVSQRPEIKNIDRGLAWLDEHFEDTIRVKSEFRSQITGLEYYLYCLERVGLASGYKYFGASDWYKRGAAALLKQQESDGAWRGGFGGVEQATAFSLLFLIRGRNPVLLNKLQFNGDWNNRPRALASLTEWMSRAFEGTVNWQIINMKAPVSEWHDAPILFLTGSKAPTFSDEELAKIKSYVLQGGTILSVTECSGAAFNKGMRVAYQKMFPDYEMKPVEKDHALNNIQFQLKGKPKFHMVSNGIRPLAIHVEEDMSLPWQTRMTSTEPWAYEAAANVCLYVTDKGSMRARGVNHWPEPPAGSPSKKVKVARLKYAGNWDPEPLAYERMGRLLAQEAGIGLEVAETEIKDLAGAGAAVAAITGTGALQVSEAEKAALKKFVEGGGLLLIDAAGGSRAFAESAEGVIGEVFGAAAIKRLSADSPAYSAKEIKDFRYRRQAKARLAGAKGPQLQGVTVGGKLAVVFSREDLTGGLVGYASFACDGYAPQTAYEILRNVMMTAAGGAGTPASAPAGEPAGDDS